jgi:hypothetical protein
MNWEISSQIAGVVSCFLGFLSVAGLRIVYININKQKNNIIINGDAVFEKSFNMSNKVEKIK